MCKLREQFLVNDRLREYIERMLSIIIENNPQLLEIAIDGNITMEMPTTNQRKQSLIISSKQIEDKPVIPPELEPEPEPLKPRESNNKSCRL